MKDGSICDICIAHGVTLRMRTNTEKYSCSIENGLKVLEGQYRKMTEDNDDYNYECLYRTPVEEHSKIFRTR